MLYSINFFTPFRFEKKSRNARKYEYHDIIYILNFVFKPSITPVIIYAIYVLPTYIKVKNKTGSYRYIM